MARQFKIDNIDEKTFIAKEKYVLLGSEKLLETDYIETVVKPKILKDTELHYEDFWGTIRLSDKVKAADWKGTLEFSNKGNNDFVDELVKTEIKHIKEMFPAAKRNKITERFISFENISFNFSDKIKQDEIPEIELTLMLKKDQGAVVFYCHTDKDTETENLIEYIQPRATTDHNTNKRDRLIYNFKALPKQMYTFIKGDEGILKLSDDPNPLSFVVKILTFTRGKFKDSKETIEKAEFNINTQPGLCKVLGLHKKHKLKIYNPRKNKFVKAKRSNISSGKKTLFLMHGTFSSTKGSFKDLYRTSDWLKDLSAKMHYQQIIAFDHPTLFYGAKGNIAKLFEILDKLKIDKFIDELDFIATSQGGLLVQYLANLDQNRIKVGKAALVASANGVDYLTTADYVPKFLSFLKNISKKTGKVNASVICAIAQHSVEYLLKQPGLLMMKPGSEELKSITDNNPYGKTCYLPVIDDFNNSLIIDKKKWIKWLAMGADTFTRLIMGKFNDWVVASQNQFLVPKDYCVIPDYDPNNFQPYIIPSVHGHCLGKNKAKNLIEDFLSINKSENESCEKYLKEQFIENHFKKPVHTDDYRYDAHCHILSKQILTKRLLLLLIDAIKNYNFSKEKKSDEKSGIKIKNLIKYLLLNKDCKDTFSELKDLYKKSDPKVIRFVPLMMDIEYCLAEDYNVNTRSNKKRAKQHLADIIEQFKDVKTQFHTDLKNFRTDENKTGIDAMINFVNNVDALFNQKNDLSHDTAYENVGTGFSKQFECFKDLKKVYKDDFLPFLAVDPRRPGIMEMIVKNVGKEKPFIGVKLYPPNGYSPTDPFLMKKSLAGTKPEDMGVYEYCIMHDIPVLTHCSGGGFANFVQRVEVKGYVMQDTDVSKDPVEVFGKISFETNFIKNGYAAAVEERAIRLNHPKLWEKVLQQFPMLRLNLAHFGGDTDERREYIFKLMSERTPDSANYAYPNLYTDLSCIVDKPILTKVCQDFFNTAGHAELKKRFLYGSDFFLNMIWGVEFEDYYKNFKEVFNAEEFDLISRENPERFLFGKNDNEDIKLLL